MTTEQKAKRYHEAIKHLKSMIPSWERLSYNGKTFLQDLFYILPELKESEDEKIRKALIKYLDALDDDEIRYGVSFKDMRTWLEKQGEQSDANKEYWRGYNEGKQCILDKYDEIEKQGEQKPDKVEPKFKVGDWIIFNENHNSIYQIERIDNPRYYLRHYLGGTLSVNFDSELIRLWTIQDAKDGDVLASKDGYDILIFRNVEDNVSFSSYYNIARKTERYWLKSRFIPATKEQRDQLEKAMANAGYTFDFEKKELKKIEQKSAWSEEDEDMCYKAIAVINRLCAEGKDYVWSIRTLKKLFYWLKSLRPQSHWKPSEEQMNALSVAVKHGQTDDSDALKKLLEQLKKLSEK